MKVQGAHRPCFMLILLVFHGEIGNWRRTPYVRTSEQPQIGLFLEQTPLFSLWVSRSVAQAGALRKAGSLCKRGRTGQTVANISQGIQ
jgi:hypothetical protein